jgi:Zn-dependent peptidase ImmA (M78 family)
MARTIKSHAEHTMLAWCRKTSRYTVSVVARKMKVPEAKIVAWEDGSASPSFHQLTRLASLYKRPTCVFYLPSPPTDFTIMKDFRSLKGQAVEFSPKLALAIREAKERSIWLSGFLKASGAHSIDLIQRFTMRNKPENVGRSLRRLLDMTTAEQSACNDKEAAFRLWRKKCEEAGVCVFMVGRIEPSEMRGFAIVDNYAPVAAVNSRDIASAKIFTLLHEMAHLLIGEEGVSDAVFGSGRHAGNKKVEVFCNAVAAEALVPSKSLLKSFEEFGNAHFVANMQMAKRYQVSEEVIARRLLDLGKVGKAFYQQIRALSIARAQQAIQKKSEQPPKEIIIPQFKLTKSRVGSRFAKAAVGAFHDGEIDGAELSRLLGMKLDHLRNLESSLFPSRIGYGSAMTS